MKNRTVLFVDDDKITLKALGRIMQSEPYRALFAHSGSHALDIMAFQTVDVVVTDLMMPEMDGMMLLDWVQAEYPETMRVVLSALTDTDSILEAINNGSVYRYIIKPWNRAELKITVRQALEMFDIQQEKKGLLSQLEIKNQLLERGGSDQVLQGLSAADLNIPLQAIFNTLDRARLNISGPAPDLDEITHLLDRIRNSAREMEQVIRSDALEPPGR